MDLCSGIQSLTLIFFLGVLNVFASVSTAESSSSSSSSSLPSLPETSSKHASSLSSSSPNASSVADLIHITPLPLAQERPQNDEDRRAAAGGGDGDDDETTLSPEEEAKRERRRKRKRERRKDRQSIKKRKKNRIDVGDVGEVFIDGEIFNLDEDEDEDEDETEEEEPLPTGSTGGREVQQHPPLEPARVIPPDVALSSRGLSDEERLLRSLFAEYNPSARPVMNSSKTVNVMINFSLMHIKDLDVRSQVLTTTGLLILQWTDERLTWKPEDHNNLTELIIEARGMWRPEFAVINGAEKIYEDYNQFRSVVRHNGEIHWEPGGVFKTMCEIDITYYPFDEQRCELTFGAWSYHTSKMNLTNESAVINMDSYKTNGEWEIYQTVVQRNEFFYECCPNERFANVAFLVYLRRRHTFYVLNVILPSIMTSVLLLSVFFCTPGQKVQIGVVVLLSFRIFLLNVSGNIPKTSDHIPLLGIYLTCIMAITTLSMVLTVFVLNLYHVTDKPVPPWAKKIVFLYLARMIGMCSLGNQYAAEAKKQSSAKAASARNKQFFRRPSHDDVAGEERTAIIELQNRTVNGTPESREAFRERFAAPRKPKPREPEEEKEDYAKDWKRMAEVFDRLFFWLFLLAILISTLVLFHPLTNNMLKKMSGDGTGGGGGAASDAEAAASH